MNDGNLTAGAAIRPARAADAEAVAALANALGRDLGGEGDAMTAALVIENFIDGGFGLDLLVAERDGALAGYALHRIDFETSYGVRGRYLSDLYVAPEARGAGLGRALLAHVAEIAAREGGDYVWWVTTRREGPARRLYDAGADVSAEITSYAATRAAFEARSAEAAAWRRRTG